MVPGRARLLPAAVLLLSPVLAGSRPAFAAPSPASTAPSPAFAASSPAPPPAGFDASVARAISDSESLLFRAEFDAAIEALGLEDRAAPASHPAPDRIALASQRARVRVIRDSLRQRPAEHRETVDQLLAVQTTARALPPSSVQARYLYTLATAFLFSGDDDRAVGYCRRAREMFRTIGDRFGEADARALLIMVRQEALRGAGDADGLIALIPELEGEITFAAGAANLLALAYNQRHLARIYLEQVRDPQRALILFRDALASRNEAGFQPYMPPSYLSLGDAYLAGDDPENAMAMWQRALDAADAVGFVRHRVLARTRLGDLRRDLGEVRQAGELYRAALRIATEADFRAGVDAASKRLDEVASPPAGVEGARLVRLTFHQADDRYPAWNRHTGALAFESRRDGNWNIYLREAGGKVRRLTDHPGDDRYPAWHPQGSHLVFQSDRGGSPQLYLLALDSGEVSQLTDIAGEPVFPDWSPDARTIAFALRRGERSALFGIEVETRLIRQLTGDAARDLWPRWSPDGRQLAFFSRRDTGGVDDEIYLYEIETGSISRLTRQRGHDFVPAWSPTGDHLAAARIDVDDRRWIEVLDLQGAEVARLDPGMARVTEPCWAPDGARIAFAAKRDGAYDIYLFGGEH